MDIGLISDTITILNNVKDPLFKDFHFHLFIEDKHKEGLIVDGIKNNKLASTTIYHDYSQFLKGCPHLMIDTNNKPRTLNTIKDWSRLHQDGMVILRGLFEMGFSQRVDKWLKRKGKKIETIVFPNISNFPIKKGNFHYLLLGGDSKTLYVKKLRKLLASNGIPLYMAHQNEIEFIIMFYHYFFFLQHAFFYELAQLVDDLSLDYDVIKKGINQLICTNPFSTNNSAENISSLIYDFLKKTNTTKDAKLMKKALEIYEMEKQWVIEKVKRMMDDTSIRNITVFELDRPDTITNISALASLENIKVYTNKAKPTIQKVEYFEDPYQATEKAELIIILSYSDEIASISLKELEKRVSKKIIIDQANVFDIYEMKSLGWIYISKGGTNAYNIMKDWR